MAGIELEARWTDEKYATKADLVANLHTSLIDTLWSRVLSYRKTNQKTLSIRTINQFPFRVTLTPIINHRINEFEKKLDSFKQNLLSVSDIPGYKARLASYAKLEMLKAIAETEGTKISDLSLKAMLNGTYRESDLTHQGLLNYREVLSFYEKNFNQFISEDLLAEIYGSLLGQKELLSFYRLQNDRSIYSAVQVNRDYYSAPAESLPSNMDALLSFIRDENCDPFVKAMMTYYEIIYLKPFDSRNEAVAALLSKIVLAKLGLGEAAFLLPIETLAKPSRQRFKELFLETQRQADITYIVLFAIEVLSPMIDQMKSMINNLTAETMRREMNRFEASDLPEEEIPEEVVVPVAKPVYTPEMKPIPQPTAIHEPVMRKKAAAPVQSDLSGELALKIPEPKMSDKEIKEFARYIVETNPSVRKPQAAFYAGHCTIGRYYTIQDYKKATRCAYETARTSMDNLAAQGFYKKLQLKNKFVYTPIAQGEKK